MDVGARKSDRRKQKRFRTVNGAYAVVQPNANKLGQIKDISYGGLAFKYIASETKSQPGEQIDIFISKHNFHLRQIPIKRISDFELQKENPFSTVAMRQQGVQFRDLSQEQTAQLKHLLQHHTVGEVRAESRGYRPVGVNTD